MLLKYISASQVALSESWFRNVFHAKGTRSIWLNSSMVQFPHSVWWRWSKRTCYWKLKCCLLQTFNLSAESIDKPPVWPCLGSRLSDWAEGWFIDPWQLVSSLRYLHPSIHTHTHTHTHTSFWTSCPVWQYAFHLHLLINSYLTGISLFLNTIKIKRLFNLLYTLGIRLCEEDQWNK